MAQLSDELLGQVAGRVRPGRSGGHGGARAALEARRGQIGQWVKDGLSVTKIGALLERQGVVVPYRTLHCFCTGRCGFGRTAAMVRIAAGKPGAECQLGFGYMGVVADPAAGPALRHPRTHNMILKRL